MSLVLFYDLETTGLPKPGNDPLQQPGIVQIGAAMVDTAAWDNSDGIVDTFNELVNPELAPDRFEPGAVKVTGLGWNEVQHAASFFTVGAEFAKFALGAEYLSGYNVIDFDNKILDWQLRRYGMEHHFPWPPRHVDIMDQAKATGRWMGALGPKGPKLTVLYQDLFGEKLEGAHDALADIKATVRCARDIAPHAFGG